MNKLTASFFILLTACLTACSPTAAQIPYGALNVSVTTSAADECFAEAMAYFPVTGECVPSSFWSVTPGLILPE